MYVDGRNEVAMKKTFALSLWGMSAVALVVSGAIIGCESPAMRKARITREEAMVRSIEQIEYLEHDRGDRLNRTINLIEDKACRDKQATADNLRKLADWLPNEVQEWNCKQPVYQAGIRRQLEGRPESIERTVPHLIY